jgi:hypothetical protein
MSHGCDISSPTGNGKTLYMNLFLIFGLLVCSNTILLADKRDNYGDVLDIWLLPPGFIFSFAPKYLRIFIVHH